MSDRCRVCRFSGDRSHGPVCRVRARTEMRVRPWSGRRLHGPAVTAHGISVTRAPEADPAGTR